MNLIHIFDFEDIDEWKNKLKAYAQSPHKFEISFQNNPRRGIHNLLCYGQSFITEEDMA